MPKFAKDHNSGEILQNLFKRLDIIHIFGSGLLKEHVCKTSVKISAVR